MDLLWLGACCIALGLVTASSITSLRRWADSYSSGFGARWTRDQRFNLFFYLTAMLSLVLWTPLLFSAGYIFSLLLVGLDNRQVTKEEIEGNGYFAGLLLAIPAAAIDVWRIMPAAFPGWLDRKGFGFNLLDPPLILRAGLCPAGIIAAIVYGVLFTSQPPK